MPTEADRKALAMAIVYKDFSRIRGFLQRDGAKLLLSKKDDSGHLPIHHACCNKLDRASLQLILDAAVEHGVIKQILEERDDLGRSNLQMASLHKLSIESLGLLLEYMSKYTDIGRILEEQDKDGKTALHWACLYELSSDLSTDFLRLLVCFFPAKEVFGKALAAKDNENKTPVDYAKKEEFKQLLQDPDCFEKCRVWLLRNHESTFLHLLFPLYFDKTRPGTTTQLPKNNLQHSNPQSSIILIALMSSPSKFRVAAEKTDSSAPMASYFDVVKKGDKKSDYNHWRKNIRFFREFYGQWPPSERKTASAYEGEGSSSCVIQ